MGSVGDSRPIGVFDSGLGGLTVLREIIRQHPLERCLYLADSREAPYGTKPAEVLEPRCREVAGFLIDRGAKAIVVACNAASVTALPGLRAHYALPFVGTVPAVKPAAALTRTGKIGVLATETTVLSESLANLIETYANDVEVVTRMCPDLVALVEEGVLEGPRVEDALRRQLVGLLEEGVDVLVLGCTHFPLLAPAMERLCGPNVRLVDPSEAVARQVGRVLDEKGLRSAGPGAPPVYYATADLEGFAARVKTLMGPLAGETLAADL